MSAAHRVFRRFIDQQAAGKVASRFLRAMSRDEAKRTLGISPRETPTAEEVTKRYRERIKETMRSSPDAAKSQEEFKDLNIAKDTLLGQFDRKEPGKGPNAPETRSPHHPPRQPPGGFNPEDDVRNKKQPEEPPPVPVGVPFAAALSGLGHVDWKILTTGHWGYDVLVESEEPRQVYFAYTAEFILMGRTDSHYVFAKMTRKINRRGTSVHEDKNVISRWDAFKSVIPLDRDLLKFAPKAIASLREQARGGRAKFMVIDGTLTEEKLSRFRGNLSLPDAIAGSGILAEGANTSTLKGRKVQIEVEPILNRAKRDAWKASPDYNETRADLHLAYDWFVYVNGKKHQLSDAELARLKKNYFLFALYSYDYEGKKNLTRLRGSRLFKMSAKEALQKLAEALDPGPVRAAAEEAAKAAK